MVLQDSQIIDPPAERLQRDRAPDPHRRRDEAPIPPERTRHLADVVPPAERLRINVPGVEPPLGVLLAHQRFRRTEGHPNVVLADPKLPLDVDLPRPVHVVRLEDNRPIHLDRGQRIESLAAQHSNGFLEKRGIDDEASFENPVAPPHPVDSLFVVAIPRIRNASGRQQIHVNAARHPRLHRIGAPSFTQVPISIQASLHFVQTPAVPTNIVPPRRSDTRVWIPDRKNVPPRKFSAYRAGLTANEKGRTNQVRPFQAQMAGERVRPACGDDG